MHAYIHALHCIHAHEYVSCVRACVQAWVRVWWVYNVLRHYICLSCQWYIQWQVYSVLIVMVSSLCVFNILNTSPLIQLDKHGTFNLFE